MAKKKASEKKELTKQEKIDRFHKGIQQVLKETDDANNEQSNSKKTSAKKKKSTEGQS